MNILGLIPFTAARCAALKRREAEAALLATAEKALAASKSAERLEKLRDSMKAILEDHKKLGFVASDYWSGPLDESKAGCTLVSPSGKVYRMTVYPEGGHDLKAL